MSLETRTNSLFSDADLARSTGRTFVGGVVGAVCTTGCGTGGALGCGAGVWLAGVWGATACGWGAGLSCGVRLTVVLGCDAGAAEGTVFLLPAASCIALAADCIAEAAC